MDFTESGLLSVILIITASYLTLLGEGGRIRGQYGITTFITGT